VGFILLAEHRIDCSAKSLPLALAVLHTYWQQKCGGRAMPSRSDIDPTEIQYNLAGRVHLLEVEGPALFRFRIYGNRVANPDARDMTGRTTLDYKDPEYSSLVTRHMSDCVRERSPICYHIRAKLDGEPYEYTRLTLPLSTDGNRVDMILVGSLRGTVPERVRREFWRLS